MGAQAIKNPEILQDKVNLKSKSEIGREVSPSNITFSYIPID
jgi:hypothetical protein